MNISKYMVEFENSNDFDRFINLTDYYHISGNDGLHDQNHSLAIDNDMLSILDNYDWSNKTFTIEIYEGIDTLHENFDLLNSKCNSNSNVKKL